MGIKYLSNTVDWSFFDRKGTFDAIFVSVLFKVSEALPKSLYIYNEGAKKKGPFKSPF